MSTVQFYLVFHGEHEPQAQKLLSELDPQGAVQREIVDDLQEGSPQAIGLSLETDQDVRDFADQFIGKAHPDDLTLSNSAIRLRLGDHPAHPSDLFAHDLDLRIHPDGDDLPIGEILNDPLFKDATSLEVGGLWLVPWNGSRDSVSTQIESHIHRREIQENGASITSPGVETWQAMEQAAQAGLAALAAANPFLPK